MTLFKLRHYKKILENNDLPFFLKTKYVPVTYDKSDSLKTMWKIHDIALNKMNILDTKPDLSLLDLKIDIAKKLFSNCIFCEHRCQIDRTVEQGKCKVSTSLISSVFIHHGEESVFTPSFTIFFSGCNLNCIFCQNYDISQQQNGFFIKPNQLTQRIKDAQMHGAINVNWVGGEPTPHIYYILEILKECDTILPQLFNSNMYCSTEALNLLSGIVDVYLTDFKFGNDVCAEQLADMKNYYQVIQRNHLLAKKQTDVFIRHLLLPNHVSCCSEIILSWIASNLPTVPVNIMDQYYPAYNAKRISTINRSCSESEIQQVRNYANSINISLLD